MSFYDLFHQYPLEKVKKLIYNSTLTQVQEAMASRELSMADFAALISPAASSLLENMAQKSQQKTLSRFGNTMQMYVPMYLSNECQNICTYCGFSYDNKIARIRLSDAQILQEAEIIKSYGYDHVLLVTGEANRTVGIDYIEHAVRILRPHFSNISIEVQPMEEEEYVRLHDAGVYAVLVYQETYTEEKYKLHHPKGKKSNFQYRIETPERLGKAGIHKIGLGVLLGLEDWRIDSFYCALHLSYLRKKYWKTKFSLSFPRLRPASNVPLHDQLISDRELVQLICAWRLFDENLELSISTRESDTFRDNIISLGITSISAGSKTNPGGYAAEPEALEQFEISDDRSPQEIAEMIRSKGYEPVWKDWEHTSATI